MAKSFNHHPEIYSDQSALEIVPILTDIFRPTNVIDVGCGLGNFLKIFSQNGVTDFLGLDGDWVDRKLLTQNIAEDKFKKIDLDNEFTSFVKEHSFKYDLLISLEVAEHLKPSTAPYFVSSLCRLSDNIIFSAAIPFQGGENHINEQWPTYWIELFKANGFVCRDVIRPKIWDNSKIHWWYRQNMLYFKRDENNAVQNASSETGVYNIVHPELHLLRSKWINDLNNGKFTFGYYFLVLKRILSKKLK